MFFLLFPLLWEVGHRESCDDLCQTVFCLFSSRIFRVSGLRFRSLIHFEFIFVYGATFIFVYTPWKESYDQPRQHIQKQRHYFVNKGPSSQGYGFSSGHVLM